MTINRTIGFTMNQWRYCFPGSHSPRETIWDQSTVSNHIHPSARGVITHPWHNLKCKRFSWTPFMLGCNWVITSQNIRGCNYLSVSSTHWCRVTHTHVSRLTIIGSDHGLSPDRRQAILWTSAGILFNRTLSNKLQWNLNRKSHIVIQDNTLKNVVWKM